MGMDMSERSDGRTFGKALLLQTLGSLLLVYVLWHVMTAFTVDLETGETTGSTYGDAFAGAFFTWLGFFVPVQLGRVAWETAAWTLFGINAGGHLVAIVAAALVFALL